MKPQARSTRALRGVRWMLAGAIAWAVVTFPAIEAMVVRAGRKSSRRSPLAAGLYWYVQERLIARLRRYGERYRPVYICGYRLQLDITDPTGRHPYFYNTPYEPDVTDAIVTALNRGDVFVDVGANIGYFAVLAAAVVGDRGRVIAFEPHTGARDALEEIIQRNSAAPMIETVPLALCDTEGEAELFVQNATSAHSTLEPHLSPMRHEGPFRPGERVRTTTLDAWMRCHPGVAHRVRCVKIDVEGAEARVVAGMIELLRAPRLTIICETTLGSQADRLLGSAGFKWRRIEPGTSNYSNFLYLRP